MKNLGPIYTHRDLRAVIDTEACIVIEGDARQILPALPDSFAGMTLTDPPYESLERHRKTGTTTRLKDSKGSSNPWFSTIPNVDLWFIYSQLARVQADNTICFTICDDETEKVILTGRNPYDAKLDRRLREAAAQIWEDPLPVPAPADYFTRAWPSLIWVKVRNGADGSRYQELDDPIHPVISMGMGYHGARCDERIVYLEKGKRRLHALDIQRFGFRRLPAVLCGRRANKGVASKRDKILPWWTPGASTPPRSPCPSSNRSSPREPTRATSFSTPSPAAAPQARQPFRSADAPS